MSVRTDTDTEYTMEASKESLQKNCGVLGLKFSPHFLKGKSFFEALPVYFEASNECGSSTRQVVIDKIRTLKDNKVVLDNLKLAGFPSFDDYMLCMVSDASYVDDMMIKTTAGVLKRNIWVVQSSVTNDSYNLSKVLKRFPNKPVKEPIILGCYQKNCFIDLVYSDKFVGPEFEGYSPLDCLINEVNLLESCEKLHVDIRVCHQLDWVDEPATGQTLLLAVADQLKLIKPLDYETDVKKLSQVEQSEECFAEELQRDIWIVNGSGELTVVKGGLQKPHLLIGHCHGNQYHSLQVNLLTQEEQEYSVPNDSFHKNYDTCTENDVECSTTSTTGDNNDGIFKVQQLMQLVYVDKTMQDGKTTHKFTLNPRALSLMNVLPGNKNELIVMAMFGKTRLGKSSLLNMWCDLSTESFQIVDTSDGCTKGIWMCHGRQDGRDIIVLDCQGSDDSDEDDSLDVKLALFCLQASTVMIVNHQGTLNRSLFDHLRFLSLASLRNKDLLKSPGLALLLRDCHYKDIDHEKYRKKLEELKKKKVPTVTLR